MKKFVKINLSNLSFIHVVILVKKHGCTFHPNDPKLPNYAIIQESLESQSLYDSTDAINM